MAGSSTINIILNAVDKYSSTLVGLDSALNIVGKGLTAMKGIADVAFAGLSTAAGLAKDSFAGLVDLAVLGGNFREMQNQFTNVAKSWGVDGEAVKRILEDVTDNVISMNDTIALSSKGIAAGFGIEELETIFTFIKRRTEATGEDFEAMADRMITALQKGRFTTLADMGLIIEKGETVSTMLGKIKDATQQYGDTGFNVADKIGALSEQWERFKIRLGDAINASPELEKFFTELKDDVVDFIRTFDATSVTKFVDKLFVEINKLYDGFSWADIKTGFEDLTDYIASIDFAQYINTQKIVDKFKTTIGLITAEMPGWATDLEIIFKTFIWTTIDIFDVVLEALTKIGDAVSLVIDSIATIPAAFERVYDSIVQWLPSFGGDEGAMKFEVMPELILDESKIDEFAVQYQQVLSDRINSEFSTDKISTGLADRATKDAQKTAQERLIEVGRAVNWPAEFQNLGEFLFNFMVQTMAGQAIPPIMAITTAR
jgi:hypothetical protein